MKPELERFYVELYRDLPRCGPGSVQTVRKAYKYLENLPVPPRILDIGAGTGRSAIELVKLSKGKIMAIDIIQGFLDEIDHKAEKLGLRRNIHTQKMSMDDLKFEEESFDVIWSEGSIYLMGFQAGLEYWKKFVKKGGYLVVSNMVWYSKNPPGEARNYWMGEYPDMKTHEQAVALIERSGYELITHFKLDSKEDFWENYYIPVSQKAASLKKKQEMRKFIDLMIEIEQEIEIFKKYHEIYGYMMYVM